MGERSQDPLRHVNQDQWDRQRSEYLARNSSDDSLLANLERTRQAISGEVPNGRDQAFNEIHARTLQEKLGERGIATEIYRPEE